MNDLAVFSEGELNTINSTEIQAQWEVEVFYDSDCPLCRKEIAMIRWLDRRNRVLLTDIAAPDFKPDELGKSFDDLMAEIHGRLPNGDWLVGVEVFRRIYQAIGFGFFVWPTRLPIIRQMLELAYRWFAKNRLRFTGRCREGFCEIDSSKIETNA